MGMDQKQKRREGSRRAQASKLRHLEARQKRKNRNILLVAVTLIIAIGSVIGILLMRDGGDNLGYPVREIGAVHSPPFDYVRDVVIAGEAKRVPPTSGNHLPRWSSYGFLGEDLIPEQVVHNMEHGAVIIWYQPGDPVLAGRVNRLIRNVGQQCIVAGTFSDMSFPVAATVWGRVLPLVEFDESQLRAFIDRYRATGRKGPEYGLCKQQS